MCHCRFISGNICTPLLGWGEAMHVWGQAVHRKSLYLSLILLGTYSCSKNVLIKKNQTNWKSTLNKSHLRGSLQNTGPVLLQTVKVIKNKASLRNCYSQENPKKTWQLNVLWDPGTEIGQPVKTMQSWIHYEL